MVAADLAGADVADVAAGRTPPVVSIVATGTVPVVVKPVEVTAAGEDEDCIDVKALQEDLTAAAVVPESSGVPDSVELVDIHVDGSDNAELGGLRASAYSLLDNCSLSSSLSTSLNHISLV